MKENDSFGFGGELSDFGKFGLRTGITTQEASECHGAESDATGFEKMAAGEKPTVLIFVFR